MPNVLPTFKGWRVVIFTNDHRPPHVHVMGVEEHARFELQCDLEQLQVMSNVGFSLQQLQSIATYLQANLKHLCKERRRTHDHV